MEAVRENAGSSKHTSSKDTNTGNVGTDTDIKKAKSIYFVEAIYRQVRQTPDGDKLLDISSHTVSFESKDKSHAKQDAQSYMDRVIRHGLELKAGSIIKSIILPSAILQIGLIDNDLYQKELAQGMEDSIEEGVATPIASEMKEPTEVAAVDLDEAG